MKIFHCSYHKCLTVYYTKVLSNLYNRIFMFSRGHRHFNSLVDDFYREYYEYKISSVNNHSLDLHRLGSDFRLSRFIRDPRDLIVSGYFYHKRGVEAWSRIINPCDGDWKVVNGCIPASMGKGKSFCSYLQSLSKEDGLIAEIDFRKNHFHSMIEWPTSDHRIKVYKYEDIINNEKEIFEDMFQFYEVRWPEKIIGKILSDHFSAKSRYGNKKHIRNPQPSQWKNHFTPKVQKYFERKHSGLLEFLNYCL